MKFRNDFFNVINALVAKYVTQRNLTLLDVGCGSGDLVADFLAQDYDAFGCDVSFKSGDYTEGLIDSERIKKIVYQGNSRVDLRENNPLYSYPFPNSFFDVLFSRAVVEHVFNLDEFAEENYRILKSGGIAIHYFPSKWSVVECHTGIIFGAAFQNLTYYKLMCGLGLCFAKYKNKAQDALHYMESYTQYQSNSAIKKTFQKAGFELIDEPDYLILKYFRRGRYRWFSKWPLRAIVHTLWPILRSPIMVYRKTC